MLVSINVKNYAIIDELTIDFTDGLNVLSGETGAGKSIIIGAMSLALGGRANSDMIRTGETKMSVQSVFYVQNLSSELKLLIEENDIEIYDGEIIVSRTVFDSGRNVCKINSTIVNVSTLKKIVEHFVDIHGQHEHQKLLNQSTHISFLDNFAAKEISPILTKVENSYQKLRKLKQEHEQLLRLCREASDQRDLLRLRINEITEANLTINEDEELESQKNILANSEKLHELVTGAYLSLYDNDSNASENISMASNMMMNASNIDATLENAYKSILEAQIMIDEAVLTIRDYKDNIEFSPDELEKVQTRLNLINNLKRKYGETIEAILLQLAEYNEKLYQIENSDNETKLLEDKLELAKKEYLQFAVELSAERKKASSLLSSSLIDNLKDLAMNNVDFMVSFKENSIVKYCADGIDEVEFLIRTNLSQPLLPLSKIASGGEISRAMLSLKSIFAQTDSTETLIFDEIDTGISGRTAQSVAQKISILSKNHQIICITHLPQIASMADTHFLISKEDRDNQTYTKFTALNEDERVNEISRMIGGVQITKTTKDSATEMIAQAKLFKDRK